MSDGRAPGDRIDDRRPRSELRHWSTYASPQEFWLYYHGYVPIPMMVGISRLMKAEDISFADAYRRLLGRGAIIHLEDEPDAG